MRTPTKDLSEREALQHRITLTNALIDLGRLVKVPSEKPQRVTGMAATTPRSTSIELFRPDQDLSPTPEPRDSLFLSLTNTVFSACLDRIINAISPLLVNRENILKSTCGASSAMGPYGALMISVSLSYMAINR